MKETPVSVTGLDAGLESTTVNVDVPPTLTMAGVNDLAIVGATATVPVAEALLVVNVAPSVWPLYEIVAELVIWVPATNPALTVVSKLIDVA